MADSAMPSAPVLPLAYFRAVGGDGAPRAVQISTGAADNARAVGHSLQSRNV